MSRTLAAASLAALSVYAASPAILLQSKDVTADVASQVSMVENFVNKFLKEKAPVTDVEKDMLDLVEKTFQETTLPNIKQGDESDRKLLGSHVTAIKNCEANGQSVKDALTEVTDNIDACYAEEARLKGVREAKLKTLNGFRAGLAAAGEVSLSLLQSGAQSGAPGCKGPDTSEWEQWGAFLSRTGSWYADNAKQLHGHADAWRAAVSAHEKQKALCEKTQKDFEHKYCFWHAAINKTKDGYVECRDNAIKALDDVYPVVVENMKHRKANFRAVRHVQCLLKVILGADEDKAAGLRACMATKISTDHLQIDKPPVPETFEDDLDDMISDIATRHRGVTGDEKATIEMTRAMCEKDSIEEIIKKHDDDEKEIGGLLDAVKQCDTVRLKMGEDVAARNKVLAAARSEYQSCRAEEKRLKGLRDAASASLEGFISNARSTGPDCNLPPSEDKEGIDSYFATRSTWYAASETDYKKLWAAHKESVFVHEQQIKQCDGLQVVYEARYCEWSDAVANTRAVYKQCRDTTVPALDNTYADVLVKEKDRRDDFQQIKREECFLDQVLAADSQSRHECTLKDVDTTHLIVDVPVKPPYATADLEALGDLSAEGVACPAAGLLQDRVHHKQ